MVQTLVLHKVAQATAHPRLRVGGGEDEPLQTRQHDGAGAHRARFQRYVEGAVEQTPVAAPRRGSSQRQNLGVGRGVGQLPRAVVVAGQWFTATDQHCTNGHLAPLGGGAGLFQSDGHPTRVSGAQSDGRQTCAG